MKRITSISLFQLLIQILLSFNPSTLVRSNDTKDEHCDHEKKEDTCQLYISQSTIPGAEIGVFTGIDIKQGERIGMPEIIIPTYELEETDTLTINKYSWYGNQFGFIEGDVDGYAPGIFAMSNGHQGLFNVLTSQDIIYDTGANGYTPYFNLYAVAARDIKANEELFLDYGDHYFLYKDRVEKFKDVVLMKDYKIVDAIVKGFYDFMKMETSKDTEYQIFWDFFKGEKLEQLLLNDEQYGDVQYRKKIINILPRNAMEIPLIIKAKGIALYNEHKKSSKKSLLDGLCIGNYMYANVSTVPNAGRGAFLNKSISEGDIVISSPVIYQCGHEFLYYNIGYHNEMKYKRKQLVMNYCYTHDKSSLVLCPYGSFINLFNHNKTPNVAIRWSTSKYHTKDLLSKSVDELCTTEVSSTLMLDYVALRDISIGEELFIDYGMDWEMAWNEYTPKPTQEHKSASYFNQFHIIHTIQEYTYPKNVYTNCYFHNYQMEDESIWHLRELEYRGYQVLNNVFPCTILSRYETDNDDDDDDEKEYLYEASMKLYKNDGILDDYLVYDIPRSSIVFMDTLFTNKIHEEDVFRHSIAFPDEIFPDSWKNM